MRVPLVLMLFLYVSGCGFFGTYAGGGPDVSQLPTLNDQITVLEGQVAQTKIEIDQVRAQGEDPSALQTTLAIQETDLAAAIKQRDDIQASASGTVWADLIDMVIVVGLGAIGLGGVGTSLVQARKAKAFKKLVGGTTTTPPPLGQA